MKKTLKQITTKANKFSMLLIAILFFACGASDSPADYYTSIVNIQAPVLKNANEFFTALDANNPQMVESTYKAFVTATDTALAKLKVMKDFKGDASLKDAMSKIMEFFKAAEEKEFKEIAELMVKNADPILMVEPMTKLKKALEQKVALDAEVQEVANAFAKKNNLTLE